MDFDRVADLEEVVELDGVVVPEPHAPLGRAVEPALVERDPAFGEEHGERHRRAVVLHAAVVGVLPLHAEVALGRLVAWATGADLDRAAPPPLPASCGGAPPGSPPPPCAAPPPPKPPRTTSTAAATSDRA